MKVHRTKEQCFELFGLPEEQREAFYQGWYCAGNEINQGWDSDHMQEALYEHDFLRPREDEEY